MSDRLLFTIYADEIHAALMHGRRRLDPEHYEDLLAYMARIVAEESARLFANAWERGEA